MRSTSLCGRKSYFAALTLAACLLLSGCRSAPTGTQPISTSGTQQKPKTATSAPVKVPTTPRLQGKVSLPKGSLPLPKDVTALQVSPDGKWLCAWAKADPKVTMQELLWITATASQGRSSWRRIAFGTSPGSWHPDSQRFAFSSYAKSLPTVKVVQLPAFGVKNLEGKGYILDQPAWSPNGKSLIAYGSDLTGKGEYDISYGHPVAHYLAILNARGRIRRKIKVDRLPDALYVSTLNWSPDSKRVSFSSFYSLSSSVELDVVEVASKKDTDLPYLAEWVRAVPAPWLNERWFVLNLPPSQSGSSMRGGIATSTPPLQHSYFPQSKGRQPENIVGNLQDYMRGKNNLFYVVLDDDKNSVLWRGQVIPTPHLTTKLRTLPKSITAFDARNRRLWVVDRGGRTVTPIPLT